MIGDPLGNGCMTLGTAIPNLRLYTQAECTTLGGLWDPSSVCFTPGANSADPTTWISTKCAPLNSLSQADIQASLIPPPKQCPTGTYNNTTGGSSLASCKLCKPGTYCPGGGSAALQCPIGKYCPISGMGSANACPAGYSCPTAGGSSPIICPVGTYSPLGSSVCTPCAQGTYSTTTGASTCTPCGAGTYSSTTGANSSSSCIPCRAGTYSAAGATICAGCPVGTFNSSPGLTYCSYCPSGTATTTTSSTSCTPCAPGGYCPGPPAGAGSYTGGTNSAQGVGGEILCPPGTGGSTTGGSGSSVCKSCPAGSYNSGSGKCSICPIGTYNSTVGASKCTVCTPGTYNPNTGSTSASSCLPCTAGNYCPPTNDPLGNGCMTLGTAIPNLRLYTQAECTTLGGLWQASSICFTPGANSADSTTWISTKCAPLNTISPTSYSQFFTGNQIPCPAGTYSGAGASQCTSCWPGSYSTTGSLACKPCASGTINTKFGASSCNPCPAGTASISTGITTLASWQGYTVAYYQNMVYNQEIAYNPNSLYPGYTYYAGQDCVLVDEISYLCLQTYTFDGITGGLTDTAYWLQLPSGIQLVEWTSGYGIQTGLAPYNQYYAAIDLSYFDWNSTSQPISSAVNINGTVYVCIKSYYFNDVFIDSTYGPFDYTNTTYWKAVKISPIPGVNSCTPCAIGKYSTATGASTCTSCPTGKTTTATGAISLTACI